MTTDVKYEEMKNLVATQVCAQCGGELTIRTNPESGALEVWCPHHPDHHGYAERETYTQAMRRGEDIHPVIRDRIEKKMLPGGYPLGVALALIKTRFPRADMDDPSAALFAMDCMRLDLDPLLGEIVPVTFKSTDKATGEVHKVVTPILTEDGWLSLCARACPDRWAGPPITEPITDKEFKKDLCDEEDAWVWKATGKTKDGTESIAYGWLKQKEYKKAREPGKETPAGGLPGNQARVRAIKRWVRETFPEAKAKMKELTSEWLTRGKDIEEVQEIIAAEYHIVTEITPSGAVEKSLAEAEKPAEKVGAAAPTKAKAQAKQETSLTEVHLGRAGGVKAVKVETPTEEKPQETIEGEGFSIDLTWLNEAKKTLKWTEDTCKTFLVSQYKVSPQGTLEEVIARLSRQQAEEFVKEITKRVEKQQPGLFSG